jgi:hypothetical protein
MTTIYNVIRELHGTQDICGYLTSLSFYVIYHVNGIWKVFLIPYEVLVFLGIFDIKPEDVNRHIFFVEPLLYRPNIIRADIVPPTLVITERPMRREHRSPC